MVNTIPPAKRQAISHHLQMDDEQILILAGCARERAAARSGLQIENCFYMNVISKTMPNVLPHTVPTQLNYRDKSKVLDTDGFTTTHKGTFLLLMFIVHKLSSSFHCLQTLLLLLFTVNKCVTWNYTIAPWRRRYGKWIGALQSLCSNNLRSIVFRGEAVEIGHGRVCWNLKLVVFLIVAQCCFHWSVFKDNTPWNPSWPWEELFWIWKHWKKVQWKQ